VCLFFLQGLMRVVLEGEKGGVLDWVVWGVGLGVRG